MLFPLVAPGSWYYEPLSLYLSKLHTQLQHEAVFVQLLELRGYPYKGSFKVLKGYHERVPLRFKVSFKGGLVVRVKQRAVGGVYVSRKAYLVSWRKSRLHDSS